MGRINGHSDMILVVYSQQKATNKKTTVVLIIASEFPKKPSLKKNDRVKTELYFRSVVFQQPMISSVRMTGHAKCHHLSTKIIFRSLKIVMY